MPDLSTSNVYALNKCDRSPVSIGLSMGKLQNAISGTMKAAVVEAAFFRCEGAGLLAGNGYFGIRTVSMTWTTPFD